jgi:hypothetical protein
LDLWISGLHASGIKILLMMAVVQSLNLVIFAWFNRVAGLRILIGRHLSRSHWAAGLWRFLC